MATANQLSLRSLHGIRVWMTCALLLILYTGQATSQGDATTPMGHVVLAMDSGVTIRFAIPGSDSHTAELSLTVGQIISSYDILSADSGQSVTILCSDGEIDSLTGEERVVCQQSPVIIPSTVWDGVSIFGRVRSNLPLHVVSPRNGLILTNRPDFVLSDEPNDKNYRLKLIEANTAENIWSADINQRIIPYPLQDPLFAIRSGGTERLRYQLVLYEIAADGRELPVFDPQIDLGFCVVLGSNRSQLEGELQKVIGAPYPTTIDDEARAYARAVFYFTHGLYSEARAELIAIVPPINPSSPSSAQNSVGVDRLSTAPVVYFLLARSSRELGLLYEGNNAYQRAQDLAVELQDVATLARIYEDRADILSGTGDQSEAESLYMQARSVYTEMRDSVSTERINLKLDGQVTPPEAVDACG